MFQVYLDESFAKHRAMSADEYLIPLWSEGRNKRPEFQKQQFFERRSVSDDRLGGGIRYRSVLL